MSEHLFRNGGAVGFMSGCLDRGDMESANILSVAERNFYHVSNHEGTGRTMRLYFNVKEYPATD